MKNFYLYIFLLFPSTNLFSQIIFDSDTVINKNILNDSLYTLKSQLNIFDFLPNTAKRSLNLSMPVEFHFRNNFNRPFGQNDGDFIQAAGLQTVLRLPVGFYSKNVDFLIDPFFHVLNATKYEISPKWGSDAQKIETNTLNLRGSLRFKWRKLEMIIGNHNYLMGPTNIDHLLISNNASGFMHLKLGTKSLVKLGFAHWEIALISGLLESSQGKFPLENYNLQHIISPKFSNDRYYSGLLLSISPTFLKNNTFGIIRQFQLPVNEIDRIKGVYNKYFPVLGEASKKSVGGLNEDKINRDQQLTLFYRLLIPSSKSTISMEYGWNDHKWDMRDLLTSWPHSLSYILSFKKIISKSNNLSYKDLVIEYVNMKQPLEIAVRDAGDWYVHGNGEGFTHRGQILGVGGSNGIGINKLTFQYRVFTEHSINTFKFSNIKNDRSYQGQAIWNDWVFSLSRIQRFLNMSLKAELGYIRSNNYAFIFEKKKNAFQLNVSYYHQLR
jgi:hypothetical protein